MNIHDLFDFEGKEKGFEPIAPTKENIKANVGRTVRYVDFIEPYRGTYFVRVAVISGVKRGEMLFDDGERSIPIKSIKAMCIKTESQ